MSEASELPEWHAVVCPTCKSGEHLTAEGFGTARVTLLRRHNTDVGRYLLELEEFAMPVQAVSCTNCGWRSADPLVPPASVGADPYVNLVKEV